MLAQADERPSRVAAIAAPAVFAPGAVVDGRYRLCECIGSGGMGLVYRAEHLTLGAAFALKLLRPELLAEPSMADRLLLEARAASRIVSDYVVPIVDAGMLDGGVPFLVMPLLVGQDLRALLARSDRLPPVRAVNLGLDACLGLSAAHARGLIHRDLKPANLFVTRAEDGTDRVKLLDFGVVKEVGHETTRPGGLVGTVRYMAPEQMGLDAPIGPATDVFALGVILYRCLAGDVPFAGDTTERIIFETMTARAPPLGQRCPGLPEGLAEVIARALAKHPAQRFASAEAFADALLPYAGAQRTSARQGPATALDATLADAAREVTPPPMPRDARPTASSRSAWSGRRSVGLGGLALGAALALAWAGERRSPATPGAPDPALAGARPAPDGAGLTAARGAALPAALPSAALQPAALQPAALQPAALQPAPDATPLPTPERFLPTTPALAPTATPLRDQETSAAIPASSSARSAAALERSPAVVAAGAPRTREGSARAAVRAAGEETPAAPPRFAAAPRRRRAEPALAESTEARRQPPPPSFDPENPYAPPRRR